MDTIAHAALKGGATTIKPVSKSLWGYGGVLQAPDGTILTVATSAKKDKGPASHAIDDIVLLLGVEDVTASRDSYVKRGLTVGKSFLRTYVEFDMPGSPVKLALQRRRALAKNAGVPEVDQERVAWQSRARLERSPIPTDSSGRRRSGRVQLEHATPAVCTGVPNHRWCGV